MVMHFNTCCCGCSLKTGALLIGILEGVSSFLFLIGLSVGSNNYLAAKDAVRAIFNDPGMQQNPPLTKAEIESMNAAVNAVAQSIGIVLAISATIQAIRLLFSIMLVFGASSDRPGLVRPWIIFAVILTVLETAVSLALAIFFFKSSVAAGGIIFLIMIFVAVVIYVYFILVVNSYHTTLLQSNTMQMQ